MAAMMPGTLGNSIATANHVESGALVYAKDGATAVIQPGGSMRDDEVIAAADQAGLAMVFTGTRHFRH